MELAVVTNYWKVLNHHRRCCRNNPSATITFTLPRYLADYHLVSSSQTATGSLECRKRIHLKRSQRWLHFYWTHKQSTDKHNENPFDYRNKALNFLARTRGGKRFLADKGAKIRRYAQILYDTFELLVIGWWEPAVRHNSTKGEAFYSPASSLRLSDSVPLKSCLFPVSSKSSRKRCFCFVISSLPIRFFPLWNIFFTDQANKSSNLQRYFTFPEMPGYRLAPKKTWALQL